MSKISVKLLFVCVASLVALMPVKASAQLLKNTPFDPGTWDPSDWVATPPPPNPPKLETIVVRNTGTTTVNFAYGNGRTISGWVNVKPGQSESRTVSLSNGIAYLLIERKGEPIKIGDRRTHYVPYHPEKGFKLIYQGDGDYSVSINGEERGVFNRKSLRRLGFSGEYFAEVAIKDGGTYTFTAK
jgi:hypothetical protein